MRAMAGGSAGSSERRRGWLAAAAVVVLITACSGGGGGGGGRPDDGAAAEEEEEPLPRRVCELLDELEETQQPLWEQSTVFDMDAAALDELLTRRREILGELAERTEGELRSLLEDQVLSQPAFDEVLLDGWDQDRARLAEAHDDHWMGTVLGESVTRDDGEVIHTSDFEHYRTMAYEQLVIGCRAPELAGGPQQETSEDPPEGRLVFVGPKNRYEGAGDGDRDGVRLVVTDSSGNDPQELPPPPGWTLLGNSPNVLSAGESPDDDRLLVAAQRGNEFGTLVVSSTGEIVEVVRRGPRELACPVGNDAGDLILGLDNNADADERRLHVLNLTTSRYPSVQTQLDLPFAAVGCGEFVDDDRIVVSDAARELADDRGVWTVGLDGSDPEEVFAREGCTTDASSVDPDGSRVAIAQSCIDPLLDGVWVVDLATGEADHIVTGHAGRPKWSPDGEWLVFGFSPLGEGAQMGVWQVRADGRQLRQVVEPLAYTPVWLPPADG